jgi:hypothetical protein
MKKVKAEPQETDFDATHRDEFAGQGGSYIIENGKRRLVERTGESVTRPAPAGNGRASDDI